MRDDDWGKELRFLEECGVTIGAGLSEGDLARVERFHGFRFPPDLREFLKAGVPVDCGFVDWRQPESDSIRQALEWRLEGLLFDVEQNAFWIEAWGERPVDSVARAALVTSAVARAPRLIPICAHRYLPDAPAEAGNPVLSVWQTDIICYGSDLRRYLACEFKAISYEEAVAEPPRKIAFWSALLS
jgi:hypothetical protein